MTWEEASSLISVSMASRMAFDGRRVDEPTPPESEIYPDQAFAWNLIDAILGAAPSRSSGTLSQAAMDWR